MAGLTLRYPPHELARNEGTLFPRGAPARVHRAPWDGVSFRHFQDPQIVCIEHYWQKDRRAAEQRRGCGRNDGKGVDFGTNFPQRT